MAQRLAAGPPGVAPGDFLATDPSVPGALLEHPLGSPFRSRRFIVDPNQGGTASELGITGFFWGRLVNIYDMDANGLSRLIHQDFVIDPALASDGQNFLLTQNQATTEQKLVILHPADSSEFRSAFRDTGTLPRVDAGLMPIFDVPGGSTGPFTMVPRNAAVVVRFDDLVDQSSLDGTTLRIDVGVPPAVPIEVRLTVDQNYGAVASVQGAPAQFYTTRAIADLAVSPLDAQSGNPPLPVNPTGLPPSVNVSNANIEIELPTRVNPAVGQLQVLTNVSGSPIVAANGNGSFDPTSPTLDVVRAARSGGRSADTGDPFNGFLQDDEAPRIVGSQPADLVVAPIQLSDDEFRVPDFRFQSTFCARALVVGDAIVQPGVIAEVIDPGTFSGGNVSNAAVRLVAWPSSWPGPGEWVNVAVGAAQANTVFDPALHAGIEACFVTVSPTPSGFPNQPMAGVFPGATFGVRFGEAMNPEFFEPATDVLLTRSAINAGDSPALPSTEYIAGGLMFSADLQSVAFVPDLPLDHTFAAIESYFFSVLAGNDGGSDLTGVGVQDPLGPVNFFMEPAAPTGRSGGRISRFTSADEEAPFGAGVVLPEWWGQSLFDLANGTLRPRPVTRFLALADRSQPLPGAMTPFVTGVQTPLTAFGAKLQALYRYADFGFSLSDNTSHNLDVEGLHWAPVGGQVVADSFSEFEIRLAHAGWAPDEAIDPASLFPMFPTSGLQNLYDDNLLEPGNYPQEVVHERARGYTVSPGDLFTAPSGTRLMPYPMNRGLPMSEWRSYTWRDTSIPARAADMNGGAPPLSLYNATGQTPPSNQFYDSGELQTIGLPLVMEFRTFPDSQALGVNGFDVSLAVNSSAQPYFRAFSAGGIDASSNIVLVNPDLETEANGGYNPGSVPPGQPTFGRDGTYYVGAADMVVRVSRTYSLWFSALEPGTSQPFANPTYAAPGVWPPAEAQPAGTSISLAFRGTDSVGNAEAETDAKTIDSYGDHYPDSSVVPPAQANHNSALANLIDGTSMGFLAPGESIWRDDLSAIDGKEYYQVRITFESNTATGLTPILSSLGVSWRP
ncbi:MAG: hypothetical protein GY711_04155 [bacterium]|nr:hypothetical protein [bacterium]